jgi:hypothetical protein
MEVYENEANCGILQGKGSELGVRFHGRVSVNEQGGGDNGLLKICHRGPPKEGFA